MTLAALRDQLDEYLAHVDALESEHGQAVKVVEMCERISGTVAAVSARAATVKSMDAAPVAPAAAPVSGVQAPAAQAEVGSTADL